MTPSLVLVMSLQPLMANAAPTHIPTYFEADRVFATPVTRAGQRLKLYIDTGGGGNLLCRAAAERLHLKLTPVPPDPEAEAELGKNLNTTLLPQFQQGAAIPPNVDGNAQFLVPDCAISAQGKSASTMGDGLLSNRWFAGRVWTWNYPARTLTLQGSGWKADASERRVAIGFRKASAQTPAFHMPRIAVRVDGEVLDLLLDTGATGYPTAAGQSAQGGEQVDGARATSFITTSMLEKWHAAHADWLVIPEGDDLFAPRFRARLIRVPKVDIAGWNVGPIWFTERPDRGFQQTMSNLMDKPIQGALGGNALNHFTMTIDYPGAAAYFRCMHACVPTPQSAP